MKHFISWLLFGFLVSCSSHAATQETWVITATAQDATTGKILGTSIVKDAQGKWRTFTNGPDCVKAALDMGPMPVRNNVAISMLCHKVDTV